MAGESLTDSEIIDLMKGTLKELGRGKFQQIAQTLQEYEVMGRWLRKDRMIVSDGTGIQRTLMVRTSGAAKHVGLYEADETNVVDLLEQLSIPWVHAQTYWVFERRETLMNRGKSLITNIVQPRRAGAMIDLADELETNAWAAPSTTQTKLPFGLPFWIVKNGTQGFNGGLPVDHTTLAGINITDNPTFKNWTDTYVDITKKDLIRGLRKAHKRIKFKSPVNVRDYRGGRGDRYRLYVNEDTQTTIEEVGEQQNENLGRDIASMDGQIVFRRHPIIIAWELENDSQNPVYLIDHSTFYPEILKGDFLRETDPKVSAKQHNVYEIFVDLSYNFLCVDRRRNAVLHVA